MTESKTRPSYSQDQKDHAKQLLLNGTKQSEVSTITGIGKGTIAKLAVKLKGITLSETKIPTNSVVDGLSLELTKIQNRKAEVEELINGKLQQELDQLTQKEQAIQGVISLYQ